MNKEIDFFKLRFSMTYNQLPSIEYLFLIYLFLIVYIRKNFGGSDFAPPQAPVRFQCRIVKYNYKKMYSADKGGACQFYKPSQR